MTRTRTPRALTIAGSDSGGGAGVEADLKAFARCGVHGCAAITAITAQNTLGVSAIHSIPPQIVLAQVRAVVADIGVDAVKIGMLRDIPTIRAVERALAELPAGTPVVVDPVMVAESGARLLDPDAQDELAARIVPRASAITPNVAEARALLRRHGGARDDGELTARALLALGSRAVVLTGGHRDVAADLFVAADDPDRVVAIAGERYPDGAAHGSGCTHSSVLAAQLALGRDLLQAAFTARALAGEAVRDGLSDIGAGAGPVDVIGLGRAREDSPPHGSVPPR